MARWVKVCQLCWYLIVPDLYLPDSLDMGECSECGQHDMCANVSPVWLANEKGA